jgi:hypothetical protein
MRKTAFELYRVDLKDVKRSQKWFDEKIASMNRNRTTPNSIMLKDGVDNLTGSLNPSNLYAFYYWPKHNETLPYFDTFPLVFPFERNENSFLGLNMHYLNYPLRFSMYREMLKISGNRTLTESSKMKLNWNMIKGVSKMAPAQACVKRYLFTQVKSPFLKIDPEDWTTAMLMPLARFQGQTKESVWKDSATKRGW